MWDNGEKRKERRMIGGEAERLSRVNVETALVRFDDLEGMDEWLFHHRDIFMSKASNS